MKWKAATLFIKKQYMTKSKQIIAYRQLTITSNIQQTKQLWLECIILAVSPNSNNH